MIWSLICGVRSFCEDLHFLIGVVVTLSSILLYKINSFYCLKKVLSFKGSLKKCFVSIPQYETTILNAYREVSVLSEVSLMLNISSLLGIINMKAVCIDCDPNLRGEIHIGGPVSNTYTNRYWGIYLKNIKWIVTEEHYQRYKSYPNLSELQFDFIDISTNGKEGFIFGNDFYEYIPSTKGWAILIKLYDTSVPKKTVHLLFGCGANGTQGAVDYFVNNYSAIYREKKTDPYICIFSVDGLGGRNGEVKYLDLKDYT